jgi:hypothetical protein
MIKELWMKRRTGSRMTRWTVAVVTVTAVGAVGTAGAPPAAAGAGAQRAAVSASDPADVGNRLDIVHESFRLNSDGTATMRLRTAETWRCAYLQKFGDDGELYSASLLWEFEQQPDGDLGDRDIVGVFGCGEDGGLVFRLHYTSGAHPARTFQASRPTARTLR